MPTTNYNWPYIADGDTQYPVSHSALVDDIDAELSRVEGVVDSKPDTDTDTHTDVSDSTGVVVSDTGNITITASGAAGVSVTGDGVGGVTVDVSATDTDTHLSPGHTNPTYDSNEDGVLDADVNNAATTTDELSVSQTVSRVSQTGPAQSIPNATFTTVAYDTAGTDSLGGADTANNGVTVPAAGTYLCITNVRVAAVPAGSRVIARIDAGTTELARADSHAAISGGGTLTSRVSDVRTLTAGETVTGLVWQDSGGALDLRNVSSATYLTVARLG